jgi:hypothetical protein
MEAHDGQQRVRRLRGERNNLTFAVERHVHHTVAAMVWGAHGCRSRLLFIRGTMTAQRYINEVLGPLLCLVRSIEEGIFQQPIPTYYSSFLGFLGRGRNRIVAMAFWIPRFIAHRKGVGYMEKFIDDLPHPPTTLGELQGAVAEAWEATPREFIDNAITSMPRRTQDCKH